MSDSKVLDSLSAIGIGLIPIAIAAVIMYFVIDAFTDNYSGTTWKTFGLITSLIFSVMLLAAGGWVMYILLSSGRLGTRSQRIQRTQELADAAIREEEERIRKAEESRLAEEELRATRRAQNAAVVAQLGYMPPPPPGPDPGLQPTQSATEEQNQGPLPYYKRIQQPTKTLEMLRREKRAECAKTNSMNPFDW